jgi:protein O-mannosyl-transferase
MRRHLVVIALLGLVTFGVFSRGLQAEFVAWDDGATVPENTFVQGLDAHRLAWMFTNVSFAMRYKPLCWLSYALIYTAAGLKPAAYHLASLVFHCLNAALLYFVIRELLVRRARLDTATSGPTGIGARPSPGAATDDLGSVPECSDADRRADGAAPEDGRAPVESELPHLAWCAGLGALAWAVHPLRVEAVARVTDFTYCLALFFLLISLWCYLRANARPQPAPARTGLYWGAVAAFALSMLSYPFAFGYAVVLIVLDFWPLGRFAACRVRSADSGITLSAPRSALHAALRLLLEKVPFALLGMLVLLTLLGRLNPQGVWTTFQPTPPLSTTGKAMQACYIWAYYLWKPWVPFHLAPVYTTLVSFDPWEEPFVLSAGLVVGLTALLVWQRRRWPWALALWVCHLVLLASALGLTEHPHYPSDRYSYIPGILWPVLLAAALFRLARTLPARSYLFAAVVGASVFLLAALGAMSFRQSRIWKDSVSLFEYAVAAVGNDPYRADLHWRLGMAYARQQKLDQAVEQYRRTLALESKVPAHHLLAQALQAQGKSEEALDHYLQVLEQQPDAAVHGEAAALLASLGRSREAIAHYREALQLQPDLWPVLNNLAWLLATDPDPANRDGPAAVQLAEQARALTGRREARVMGTLAAAYAEVGRFLEAVDAAQQACSLAAAAGNQALADTNRELLKVYMSNRPFHEERTQPKQGR